jgi:DNA-binding transcriptional LysR family regulator
MDVNDFELRHIRYFVATSEALSFTRAARQLNVSQPALSHSISQLEERLGNKLFERSVKGIRLTPAGQVFEKTAHRVLREIGAGTQLVAESAGVIAGEIRLGFVKSVNVSWLPKMIGRFPEISEGQVLSREHRHRRIREQTSRRKIGSRHRLFGEQSTVAKNGRALFRESRCRRQQEMCD